VRGDRALTGVGMNALALPLKLAWSFPAGKPILATPACDAQRAYFGDGSGQFFAVDLNTGEKVWEFILKDPKTGKPSKDPIEGSACLADGLVIFGATDGFVRALDARSGAEKWKFEMHGEIKSGVTPFRRRAPDGAEAGCVVVTGFAGDVVCLRASNGEKVWEYDAGGPINGAAAVTDDGIVFGGCNGTIDVLDPITGERRQRIDIKIYMPNSVAVRNGSGYFAHSGNKVEAWDLKSPKQIWEFRDRDFAYFTSPAVTADFVFAGGEDKRLHCLQRSDGTEKWAFRARDKVNSSPVVAGPLVFVGSDDGRLYAVDAATGEERWSHEIGAPVKASPALAGPRVLIGADDGVMYCFQSARP
jgi:outer membrane protein assembly factor BamB